MTTSHGSGSDNTHAAIMGLACSRFSWDAKKMVLLLKQGKPIDKLSKEATLAFTDLGIIEPDQETGQLKVSDDYEQMVRNLTVSGLSKQFPEKGERKPQQRRVDDQPMTSAPVSGVQCIARRDDNEEVQALRIA